MTKRPPVSDCRYCGIPLPPYPEGKPGFAPGYCSKVCQKNDSRLRLSERGGHRIHDEYTPMEWDGTTHYHQQRALSHVYEITCFACGRNQPDRRLTDAELKSLKPIYCTTCNGWCVVERSDLQRRVA